MGASRNGAHERAAPRDGSSDPSVSTFRVETAVSTQLTPPRGAGQRAGIVPAEASTDGGGGVDREVGAVAEGLLNELEQGARRGLRVQPQSRVGARGEFGVSVLEASVRVERVEPRAVAGERRSPRGEQVFE